MLMRKQVPGALYLGVAAKEEICGEELLYAHAWLKCGDEFVTGEFKHGTYMAVTAFTWL